MIVEEIVTINGRELVHTYSDEGRYVVRDGVSYDGAIDPIDSGRTYTEGDVIPAMDEAATEADYQAALEEMGVDLSDEG